MPASSKKQRRFFGLVRALQKGEVPPSKVSSNIRKVAKKIDPKSAEDFAATKEGGLPLKVRMEMLSVLKDFQEPMMLHETQTNPIAKEFTRKEKYDSYVQRFVGLPFSQKEMESINNYTETKPSKIDGNQIRYESSDQFGNNTSTLIKKLRDGSLFVYTAFTKYTRTQPEETPEPGGTPATSEPELDDVIVAKSTSFSNDSDGSKILSDFLRRLDL
jgi:hypothetical protein